MKRPPKPNRHVAPPPARAARPLGRNLLNLTKAGLGALLVVATAGATVWGGYRLVSSSQHFSIQHIEVETSRRLSDREVLRRSGIALGTSLFALDATGAEAKLLEDPWIESVRVTRKLPNTVRVQLVEHEALALASLDGEVFLVGEGGEPFKSWQEGDVHDLPVLTGVTLEALGKDRIGAVARLATGLSVLDQYAKLPISRVHRAQEVHLDLDGSVVLSVGSRGVALHLGQGPWPKKLLMVADVLRTFENKQELPGVVFLDNQLHPERVVVRMR